MSPVFFRSCLSLLFMVIKIIFQSSEELGPVAQPHILHKMLDTSLNFSRLGCVLLEIGVKRVPTSQDHCKDEVLSALRSEVDNALTPCLGCGEQCLCKSSTAQATHAKYCRATDDSYHSQSQWLHLVQVQSLKVSALPPSCSLEKRGFLFQLITLFFSCLTF